MQRKKKNRLMGGWVWHLANARRGGQAPGARRFLFLVFVLAFGVWRAARGPLPSSLIAHAHPPPCGCYGAALPPLVPCMYGAQCVRRIRQFLVFCLPVFLSRSVLSICSMQLTTTHYATDVLPALLDSCGLPDCAGAVRVVPVDL
jgi:hypothetical protein